MASLDRERRGRKARERCGGRMKSNQRETQNFGSLFNEIVEILGTKNLLVNKDSSGFSISKKTHLRSGENLHIALQSVCENAQPMDAMELEKENSSCLGDTQSENLGETDQDIARDISWTFVVCNFSSKLYQDLSTPQLR
ncbi:unnamed protein product [Ilex paraguariensis]|uniref:Uncharacterized protein n=1 Tax=Ilex paraguariensis TaxID=185542 RepID=A0ABC8RM38_9AQUA